MKEEAGTLGVLCAKIRRCISLETMKQSSVCYNKHAGIPQKYNVACLKRLNGSMRGSVGLCELLQKQPVWVIIPATTFYFDKLSSGEICAQRTDVGVDEDQ